MEKESIAKSHWDKFTNTLAQLQLSLDKYGGQTSADEVTALKESLIDLQNTLTDAAADLPQYDVRRCQEEIELFRKKIKDFEVQYQPKKKFTFSSRQKNTNKKETNNEKTNEEKKENEENITKSNTIDFAQGSICIQSKLNESINLKDEIKDRNNNNIQILVKNCHSTVINTQGVIGSVRLENISDNSIAYLSPCQTSVYIENLRNCEVHIYCHQLRIHNTHNCNLFVYCNSHPIIEDCSSVIFYPYILNYPNINSDIELSNLQSAKCWDSVVDFRWHRSTPSPNWTTLNGNSLKLFVDNVKRSESTSNTSSSGEEGQLDLKSVIRNVIDRSTTFGWECNRNVEVLDNINSTMNVSNHDSTVIDSTTINTNATQESDNVVNEDDEF